VRILDVKILGGSVAIKYEAPCLNKGMEGLSVNSPDSPEPGFQKALDSLLSHWLDELEFDNDHKHEIYGIAMQYHQESGRLAAAIKGKRYFKIRNGSHSMSSSYREQPHPNNEDKGNAMTDEHFSAVREVIKEAKRYIDGHRLQKKLPVEPKKAEQGNLPLDGKTRVIKGGAKKRKSKKAA